MAKEISNVIYRQSLGYAIEHGEVERYKESRQLDIECKKAVEEAIRKNFNGMSLNHDTVKAVTEDYSMERMEFVLANTIQHQSWDGRFSNDNKAWAAAIEVPENILHGMDMNRELLVSSHPVVLDGFVNLFHEEIIKKEQKSIFGIYMYDEKRYFQNTSGLDAEELCRAYVTCDKLESSGSCYAHVLNEIICAVVKDVDAFVKSYNYDDSDLMTDYFDVNFYYFGCCQNNGEDIRIVPKTAGITVDKNGLKKKDTKHESTDNDFNTELEEYATNGYEPYASELSDSSVIITEEQIKTDNKDNFPEKIFYYAIDESAACSVVWTTAHADNLSSQLYHKMTDISIILRLLFQGGLLDI